MNRDTEGASESSHLPLAGVRVLDLSRILAGPMSAMMLGDLGAEVLKVESPEGDETRRWGPPFIEGESAYFLSLNRNKRSVALDLSLPEGQQTVERLIRRADVLIENFRPGTLERWGLDPDRLADLNPRLVHCSITGFGATGPYRDYPGFDPVIEAMSGLMSLNGPAGRHDPYKVGVAVVDVLAASHATTSVVSLLHRRARTGRGGRVEIALLDVAVASLANVAESYLVSGRVPERHGNDHPNIVPFGSFATADGSVMICAGSDRQWRALCTAIGLDPDDHPDLATNRQRVAQRERVTALVQDQVGTAAAAELGSRLMESGVPAGRVNGVDDVFRDPHVLHSGLVQTVDHPTVGPLPLVASPLVLDGVRPGMSLPPPLLGEAQDDLAGWLSEPAAGVDAMAPASSGPGR